GCPRFEEITGAALGLRALLLVIEAAGYRVVGVVHLVDEIGDCQLQLMRPEPPGLAGRYQVVAWPEIVEDVGSLGDHQPPRLEIRRGERRTLDLLAIEKAQHHTLSTRLSRDIDIVGCGLFERQPDEFAAALDPGPVIELVTHTAVSPGRREVRTAFQLARR